MDWEKQKKAGKNMSIGMAVFQVAFAVVWCVLVAAMRVWFMLLFGLGFLGLAGYRLIILLQMAKDEKPSGQPRDPWQQPDHRPQAAQPPQQDGYCPYCGAAVDSQFAYCPSCGRKLNREN